MANPENLKPFAKGHDPRRNAGGRPPGKRLPTLADMARAATPEIVNGYKELAFDKSIDPKVRAHALDSLAKLAGGALEEQGAKAAAKAEEAAPGAPAAADLSLLNPPPEPPGTVLPFPPPKETP